MGVTLFRVDKGEHVTSVFTVLEDETDENGAADDGVPKVDPTVDPAGGANDEPAGDADKPAPEEGNDG
jgi:hypothetical protein